MPFLDWCTPAETYATRKLPAEVLLQTVIERYIDIDRFSSNATKVIQGTSSRLQTAGIL